MKFQCYSCWCKSDERREDFTQAISVANDAEMDGRVEDAMIIRRQAVDMLEPHQSWRLKITPIGEPNDWHGETVWLPNPSYGVSVGPCEDCEQTRPCIQV